jgi:hypothetical protein
MDLETVTKGIGVVTATFALIGGGYTLTDKLGLFDKPILVWAPEYFEITDGPVNGPFRVIVAREKIRDDCDVTGFTLEIRDSEFVVHPATPDVTKFSGQQTTAWISLGTTSSYMKDTMIVWLLEKQRFWLRSTTPARKDRWLFITPTTRT